MDKEIERWFKEHPWAERQEYLKSVAHLLWEKGFSPYEAHILCRWVVI